LIKNIGLDILHSIITIGQTIDLMIYTTHSAMAQWTKLFTYIKNPFLKLHLYLILRIFLKER